MSNHSVKRIAYLYAIISRFHLLFVYLLTVEDKNKRKGNSMIINGVSVHKIIFYRRIELATKKCYVMEAA